MDIVQKQITLTSDNSTIMKAYALTTRLFVIVSLFFVSCSPYVDIVKVDVLSPSASTFTFAGKDVAIVGNLYELGGGRYLYDSILIAEATQGIKAALEQSPVFADYDIPIYYTYTADTSLVGEIMTKADVDSQAGDMGVDMFIAVDYVNVISDKPDNEKNMDFSMMYDGLFRVYDVASEKPYTSYIFRSDAPEYVIMYDDSGSKPLLVQGSDAKASMAHRLGENYALLIAPFWETVERVYYVSPDDEYGNLRMGDRYVQQGDWTKAMEYWNKTITTSTKKMQVAMAAFNMAVGCEMLGDLTLAISWLDFCKKQQVPKIDPTPYRQTLVTRAQDKQILDKTLQAADN